ncbi:uncharacterized protein [Penaeus vannamei]|uniref:uncharacterized protein n=1 Tax=Penaeus vannamei TaxID=6689 RepID=UPI00387F80F6
MYPSAWCAIHMITQKNRAQQRTGRFVVSAQEGHIFRECTNKSNPKCIKCGENHRILRKIKFINGEEKIKGHLEAGSIEVHGGMLIGRHKLKGIRNENKTRERADGVAIAVRRGLQHRIINNFDQEFLAIEVDTARGPIIVATGYLPPRRPYLPSPDLLKLLRQQKLVYIIGDFNGRHRILGQRDNNNVGNSLARLMADGRLNHLGPDFLTLIRQKSATSPDIVLNNRYRYFNTRITPGNITTSDHPPIIVELSIKPILIPTIPQSDYKKADWNKFKELLEDKSDNDLNGRPISDIDLTERWYDDLLEAKETSIPKRAYRTAPHRTSSPELQLLQAQYKGIKTLVNTRGWGQELRKQFKQVRVQLTETCRAHFSNKWIELATNLASKSRGPKDFWQQLRILMGNDIKTSPYLYDHQGRKLYSGTKKEAVHRTYWRNIYQISHTENLQFDQETEERVTEDLALQADQLIPDQCINLNN